MTEPVTDAKPPIAAAVVVQGGYVLMVRRRVAEGSLSWQFPAGAVEAGESDADAAVRETLEETGLTVKATALLGRRVHPATGRQMSYTACEVLSGTVRVADDEELDAVAWLTLDELPQRVPAGLFEPVQRYLDEALTR